MNAVATKPRAKPESPVYKRPVQEHQPSRTPTVPLELAQIGAPATTGSTTLMKFTVQSRSGFFAGDRVVRAQEAGFEWNDRHMLSLLSHDTGEEIASMAVHGFKEAVGELTSIDISIDPESGPLEYGLGRRFINALEDFAESMDGFAADSFGRSMSPDERRAVADHIDAVMARRFDEKHAARRRIALPEGGYKVAAQLSFITESYTKRGKWLGTDYFDVPAMDRDAGYLHGLELARETLRYRKMHRIAHLDMMKPLLAAAALRTTGDLDAISKAHVADGYVLVMAQMLTFAARHAAFEKHIDYFHDMAVNAYANRAQEKRERTADFVKRMRVAHAVKKAQQQGGAA